MHCLKALPSSFWPRSVRSRLQPVTDVILASDDVSLLSTIITIRIRMMISCCLTVIDKKQKHNFHYSIFQSKVQTGFIRRRCSHVISGGFWSNKRIPNNYRPAFQTLKKLFVHVFFKNLFRFVFDQMWQLYIFLSDCFLNCIS